MLKNILLLALAATSCMSQAQDKRRLQFTIDGTAHDTLYLANYFGNKLYYADTTVANAKGVSVFERPSGYKAGVYALVVPGPKYFEFIVNEPVIEMKSDTGALNEHLVVQRSDENKLFQAYVSFLGDKKAAADEVSKMREATEDPIAKAGFKDKLKKMEAEITDFQKKLVEENQGTYVASIVKMSIAPPQTEVHKPDGTLDSAATYYNYRAHFWDNTDLKDPRNLRTPVFQNKFDEYIGKVVPQIPDTINKCADDLIRRMDDGGDLFKFAVNGITYKYETSDIMGMDAVFVHMAQTYYCPSDGSKSRATWMDKEKLDKLCERARKEAPLIIGAKGKDIILTDTTEQNWISYYKMPQKYVLIIFWDPHCGHCKKVLPTIHEDWKAKLKPLDVGVFAVAKATDSTLFHDWKQFIRENDLDWTNVGLTWHVFNEAKTASYKFIPKFTTIESLNYADTWDVYSTPKFFLMDQDRKIVGKQLDVDQMAELVKALDKKKGKNDPLISPPAAQKGDRDEPIGSGGIYVPLEFENGVMHISVSINGLQLRKVIFDTGASDVSLSATEALFMIKQGLILKEDFIGTQDYTIADGSVKEGAIVNLREVIIGGYTLRNVKASITYSMDAPILLGGSILSRFSTYQIDNHKKQLIFFPK